MSINRARLPDGQEIEYHTAETVKLRMEEAADTLKRLRVSGTRPAGYKSNWPDIVQDFWEAYGDNEDEPRPGRPSPAKIDRMDEALAWLFWIEDRNKRIVFFAKASGVKTGAIAKRLGFSRESVRVWNREACEIILRRLNPVSA